MVNSHFTVTVITHCTVCPRQRQVAQSARMARGCLCLRVVALVKANPSRLSATKPCSVCDEGVIEESSSGCVVSREHGVMEGALGTVVTPCRKTSRAGAAEEGWGVPRSPPVEWHSCAPGPAIGFRAEKRYRCHGSSRRGPCPEWQLQLDPSQGHPRSSTASHPHPAVSARIRQANKPGVVGAATSVLDGGTGLVVPLGTCR
jgi:hypothetical protein